MDMEHEEAGQRQLISARHRARLLFTHSYPRYLWHSFRESKTYQRTLSLWVNFRRYRLISRIITIAATILTFMSTGALTLLLVLLCLLILPIALLLIGGTMLLGLFRRKRQNHQLYSEVSHHKVYLFFPEELEEHSFSCATMRELASSPNATVFVISPYTWFSRGLGGDGFYLNARQEQPHLYLLRRHYFFFFRRLLEQAKTQRIVVVL